MGTAEDRRGRSLSPKKSFLEVFSVSYWKMQIVDQTLNINVNDSSMHMWKTCRMPAHGGCADVGLNLYICDH